MALDHELFLDACYGLYGRSWIRPISVDLKVNERTVQRWANGTIPIPSRIAGELIEIMQRDRFTELIERLRAVPAD